MRPYYPTLEAEIARNGIVKKELAAELNISERQLVKKLSGEVGFWLSEALYIHSLIPYMPIPELFSAESEVKKDE